MFLELHSYLTFVTHCVYACLYFTKYLLATLSAPVMTILPSNNKILCILYSSGGTADVGRHAVQAALNAGLSKNIRVLSSDPQTTLSESNWNCACRHNVDLSQLDIRKVNVETEDLIPHLDNVGAVISGLGNRQPFHGDCVAEKGTRNVIKAMKHHNISRLVSITSSGCNEDWPPMEFHWAGRILKWIFWTVSRREYRDLCRAEDEIRSNGEFLDYLIIRPVGLGEDRPPVNEWIVQKEKYTDKRLAPDMSKLDCARFAVKEAILEPTYHKTAVVVGSDVEKFVMNPKKDESSDK
jgi:hypothetical protein